jgi:hypothetical protein
VCARTGTKFDDVISRANHIRIVFDDEHGMATLNQGTEGSNELFHVGFVESGRRFVEYINGVAPSLGT